MLLLVINSSERSTDSGE